MRRRLYGTLAVAMLAAGTLVAIAAPAGAQSEAATAPAVDCNTKTYQLLFWPEGHAAVESVDFPEYLVPHLEVYKGGDKTYPPADAVGYAEPGVATVSDECEPAEEVADAKDPKKAKSTTATSLITCKSKKSPVLGVDTDTIPGGARFTLTVGTRRIAVVNLAPPSGSEERTEVVYSSKLCKLSDAPA